MIIVVVVVVVGGDGSSNVDVAVDVVDRCC